MSEQVYNFGKGIEELERLSRISGIVYLVAPVGDYACWNLDSYDVKIGKTRADFYGGIWHVRERWTELDYWVDAHPLAFLFCKSEAEALKLERRAQFRYALQRNEKKKELFRLSGIEKVIEEIREISWHILGYKPRTEILFDNVDGAYYQKPTGGKTIMDKQINEEFMVAFILKRYGPLMAEKYATRHSRPPNPNSLLRFVSATITPGSNKGAL